MNDLDAELEKLRLEVDAIKALGGIVGRHAADAEVWQHAGMTCAIIAAPNSGWNGYVRMPEAFRSRKLTEDDVGYEEVDVHGGLTYGMDEAGWFGFDTAHAWDQWGLDPDAPEGEFQRTERRLRDTDPRFAELKRLQSERTMRDPMTIWWTKEKLVAEVDSLAVQLAAWCEAHPHAEGDETPAERHDRFRREMREAMRLHREEGMDLLDAWGRIREQREDEDEE